MTKLCSGLVKNVVYFEEILFTKSDYIHTITCTQLHGTKYIRAAEQTVVYGHLKNDACCCVLDSLQFLEAAGRGSMQQRYSSPGATV